MEWDSKIYTGGVGFGMGSISLSFLTNKGTNLAVRTANNSYFTYEDGGDKIDKFFK